MITKEQAIEILDSETSLIAVEKLRYYAGFNQDKVVELIQEAMNMGAEALKGKDTNVPSKWIPCSERLPEEDNPVFIALAWESVDIGWYRNGEWFSEFCNYDPDCGVIAWMPIPAPFVESED